MIIVITIINKIHGSCFPNKQLHLIYYVYSVLKISGSFENTFNGLLALLLISCM